MPEGKILLVRCGAATDDCSWSCSFATLVDALVATAFCRRPKKLRILSRNERRCHVVLDLQEFVDRLMSAGLRRVRRLSRTPVAALLVPCFWMVRLRQFLS